MSLVGMGADSPPPAPVMHDFPALLASPANHNKPDEEDKRDYRADDEDEYEDEVDNSFEYEPVVNYTVASEASEAFAGDDVTKEDGVEEQEQVSKEHSPQKSPLDEDEEKPSSSLHDTPAVVEKVDVERHTVIQNTTVVKKYTHDVAASDEVQQHNKHMAVAVSSSSAVINHVKSSTHGLASVNGLGDGSNSFISTDDEEYSTPDLDASVADTVEESRADTARDDFEDEKTSDEEEKTSAIVPISPSTRHDQLADDAGEAMDVDPDDEVVSETPQSGDTAREADDEKSDAPEQQQQEKMPEADAAPASLPDAGPLPDASAESKKPTTPTPRTKMVKRPAKSTKRKHCAAPPSGAQDKAKADDNGQTFPSKTVAAAPIHTPKRTKRASAKKPKKSPTPAETGAPGSEQQPLLRRSSRIKMEPPKFTYPVKLLADEAVLNHFDRVGTQEMACKYCGDKVTTSRGLATKHLKTCPAFERQEQRTVLLSGVDDEEEKPAAPSSTAATQVPNVKTEVTSDQNTGANGHVDTIVQLMGSKALVGKLKGSFQRVVFAGHGPISRFQELMRDDATGLRHLRVHNLLDAVNLSDGPIVQLHTKQQGARRSTGQDLVMPVSKAKSRNFAKFPLRFPAPCSVAEHFVVPLANELGLGYAMDRHKAHLVSCPQAGTLLDWRFHRTETVVFQLGSKSMWKMKKGQVECPQQCFHPESWLLDDTAHVVKAHCLASMDKDTLGFLAPPGDDLHVFDDNESGGAGEEQQEYMLKPGSVAYLPAGAWFEVETQGPNSMWLEVQLVSMPYRDLVFSALNQLAMGDKQWRMGVQLYPGDRNQAKAIRHHAEACVKSLCNDVKGLNGGDLLPEYLCTEDMQDLMALGLLHNVNVSLSSTSFEVDLTNPKFKLKHEKVFKDADYRVNPVAMLMSADEIPHLLPEENEEQSAEDSRPLHHALKKTPKPKRKQALRVIALTGKHTYVLDEMFGNAALESRLHVKFQCSASQSRMVEWLRGRGTEPFNLDEFHRCDVSLHQSKRPAQGEENARLLLRFLCFVGYVTQMKKLPA